MLNRSAFLLFSVLLATGCTRKAEKVGVEGASCNASADCAAELQCMRNVCVDLERGAAPAAAPGPENRGPTALKAGPHRVSADECRALARKVVELRVQAEEGQVAEMARSMHEAMIPDMERECMSTGTKDEIQCVTRASSREELERCEDSKKRDLRARAGRPSEASCRAFADKVVELTVEGLEGEAAKTARTMIETMRPEMLKDCSEMGSNEEIDCALQVTTLDELERCGRP